MGDPPQNNCMDKPCEICGDMGYAGCIRLCCKCKITREHPYCMRILHQGDPDDWVCEECKSQNQIPSLKSVPNKAPSDPTARSAIRKPPRNTKVVYLTPEEAMKLESGTQKKIFPSPSKSNFSRAPTVGRTPSSTMSGSRYTTPPPKFSVKADPYDAPPGFQKIQSNRSLPNTSLNVKLSPSEDKGPARRPWQETPVSKLSPGKIPKPNAARENINSGRISPKPLQKLPAINSKKGPAGKLWPEPRATKPLPPGKNSKPDAGRGNTNSMDTSPQSIPALPSVSVDEGPARQLSRETSDGRTLHLAKVPKSNAESANVSSEHASVQSVHKLPVVSSGMVVRADTQQENFGSDGRESLGLAVEFDRYLLNHPAEIPTWKGSFNIMHEDDVLVCQSIDGIQAHPPCKVHRKAYNLSKKLPKTLQFELVPRFNVWVNLFEDDVPDVLDIGLYFLTPRSLERNFSSLLKVLDDRDLLLRTEFDGVELLLFSSRHLPEDSQKINQNFFLWGLFREYADEDMNIDMAGGYEVGVLDNVVPKPVELHGGHEVGVLDNVVPKPVEPAVVELQLAESKAATVEEIPIKPECPDVSHPVFPLATSCLQDEEEIERELQKCFDRFVKLKQPEEDGFEIKVKVEPGLPGSC